MRTRLAVSVSIVIKPQDAPVTMRQQGYAQPCGQRRH
jgi:hypothetical protein